MEGEDSHCRVPLCSHRHCLNTPGRLYRQSKWERVAGPRVGASYVWWHTIYNPKTEKEGSLQVQSQPGQCSEEECGKEVLGTGRASLLINRHSRSPGPSHKTRTVPDTSLENSRGQSRPKLARSAFQHTHKRLNQTLKAGQAVRRESSSRKDVQVCLSMVLQGLALSYQRQGKWINSRKDSSSLLAPLGARTFNSRLL